MITATAMAMSGMPAMVSLGMSRKAFGSDDASTSLPPTIRMSMPRMMYSVASVTTRLGTRPAATMIPLATPQARPMPRPARKTTGIGMPGWSGEQAGRQVGGQADHRAHRQVHVPADHHHRLAEREQREGGRVDQHELDVRRVEEAVLHERGDRDEDDEDDEDAGLADPEDPLGEAGVWPCGRAAAGPAGWRRSPRLRPVRRCRPWSQLALVLAHGGRHDGLLARRPHG